MADKRRTPNPPRKVQAPQVRQKSSSSAPALPWTNILIGLGVVAIAALAIVLFVTVAGGAGSKKNVAAKDVKNVRAAMVAAGCTFTSSKADAANQHMSSPDQKVKYDTFPPSSGVHNPTTAIWGNYRTPADPRQAVHNLEHGGIIVWYGPNISAKDRGELDAFYDEDSRGVLITPLQDPYPGVSYPRHQPLGSRIALTTWTANTATPDAGRVYIAMCPHADVAAFAAFRDAFRGLGPERIPASAMSRGSN
jgi:hypothetical protein